MLNTRQIVRFAVAAGFAFAMIAFAPEARAQAMGEYGGAVGNAAVTAGSAPAIAPDVGGNFKVSTQGGGSSGASQTVEIREDDSEEAAAPPRARRHGKHAADSDDGGPDSDWTEVK